MKKFMYVLTLMFAVVLMSTSCTKPNDDVLIPTDLTGAKWNCISLDYAGTLYDTPAEFVTLNLAKDFVSLDLKFNADLTVTLYTNYTGTNVSNANMISDGHDYSVTGDVLSIDNTYLQFQVISYAPTKLVLKMTKGDPDMPIGGTYILTR